ATTLLAVLMHGSMLRMSALCPSLKPRQLVDDVSLQWTGHAKHCANELGEGIDQLKFELQGLQLPIQIKKLGYVAASSRGSKAFRSAARARQAAGITPSVTHGASVSGVSDAVLKPIRSIAALLAGVRPTGSICMGMPLQDQPHYDPLYAATINIVFMYASMLREGRLGMQALGDAWEFVNGQMSAQPSWSRVRGPLGALWLTLHRIGWRLASSTSFESDLGTVLDLNQMAPRDVRDQVVQGVTRWLLARAESHIETHNGEQFWHRGIRRCVEKAVRDPSERGSLQCVWTDAMWPRQKKYEKRLVDCGKCLA
ncbi:unnamed protein product, partial [Prorocentrum cordatum]